MNINGIVTKEEMVEVDHVEIDVNIPFEKY